ncbi:MAG: GTPase ObgE, partial [Clostridiales bacterium]
PKGDNGQGSSKMGKCGQDIYLKVPLGTIVRFDGEDEVFADLVEQGQTVKIAKGGRGGKGNARFASNREKAPQFAEKGEPGEEFWVRLELKVLADVGLVGMPNAGKSTFISKVSSARPKIADYPFTTLEPNLGIVKLGDEQSFCIADVPGLIENAHEGAGLGHHFLRHLERTKAMIHLLDMSGQENRDPLEDFKIVTRELEKYKTELGAKPRIIAANKMDLPNSEENYKRLVEEYGEKYEIYPLSAIQGENLNKILYRIYEIIQTAPDEEVITDEEIKVTTFKEREPFTISRGISGELVVEGDEVKKWVAMTDFNNEDAVKRLQRIFKAMGLDKALRKAGAKDGDMVMVYGVELEYTN